MTTAPGSLVVAIGMTLRVTPPDRRRRVFFRNPKNS
jgi:hypothetical protein